MLKKGYIKQIIVIYIVYMIIIGLFAKIYSPIDEAMHFDYIINMSKNHSLPNMLGYCNSNILDAVGNINVPATTINHESVQPPLYYFFSTIFTYLINDYRIKFFFIRFLGIFIALLNLYIINKACTTIINTFKLKKEKTIIHILLILFAMNPGYIIRLLSISNEGLAILLTTATIYMFINMITKEIHAKHVIITSILISMAFLTKITTLYLLPVFILVLIYKRKKLMIIIPVAVLIICVTPWLAYNYHLYGALTGTAEHLKIVIPIANPNLIPIDVIAGIPKMFQSFFIAQEIHISELTLMFTYAISVPFLILMIKQFFFLVKQSFFIIKNKFKFTYTAEEKKKIMLYLFSILLICNVGSLIVSSISTKVGVMLGRYMYISILPILGIILLMGITFSKLQKVIIICFISFGFVDTLSSTLEQNIYPVFFYDNVSENVKAEDAYVAQYDTTLALTKDHIKVKSGHKDPQIVFKVPSNMILTQIEISYQADVTDDVQVFINRNNQGFNPSDSKLYKLEEGTVSTLVIDNLHGANEVRLDPPNDSNLTIYSIKFIGYKRKI